jgi:hypothetical protein
MSENLEGREERSPLRASALSYFSHRWEEIFFFHHFLAAVF